MRPNGGYVSAILNVLLADWKAEVVCFAIAAVIAYLNHRSRMDEWRAFEERRAQRLADFHRRLHERTP